jgi:hypothetical protein
MEREVEVWKDVVSYEEYFRVSNFGNVYSKRTNKILTQTVGKTGYYQIATRVGGRKGKCFCFKVHRLVAMAFIDNKQGKPFVNHIDGDKLNNCVDNLEWCTVLENNRHAIRIGLVDLAALSNRNKERRKLSESDIQYIRENFINGDKVFGARSLGRKFEISHTVVMKIVNYKLYSDLP